MSNIVPFDDEALRYEKSRIKFVQTKVRRKGLLI